MLDGRSQIKRKLPARLVLSASWLILLTLAGLVLLRPGDTALQRLPAGLGPQTDLIRAELVSREVVPCPERTAASPDGVELVPLVPVPDDLPGVACYPMESPARLLRFDQGSDHAFGFLNRAVRLPCQERSEPSVRYQRP